MNDLIEIVTNEELSYMMGQAIDRWNVEQLDVDGTNRLPEGAEMPPMIVPIMSETGRVCGMYAPEWPMLAMALLNLCKFDGFSVSYVEELLASAMTDCVNFGKTYRIWWHEIKASLDAGMENNDE